MSLGIAGDHDIKDGGAIVVANSIGCSIGCHWLYVEVTMLLLGSLRAQHSVPTSLSTQSGRTCSSNSCCSVGIYYYPVV